MIEARPGSITDHAALIARRKLSPVELVEAALARIARLEDRLHAFITVTGAQALEEARRAESEIMRGEHRGPLHGIPFAVKDIYYTAGVRTTGHSRVRQAFVPDFDATAVARLRKSGAILLGKLATHEFAHGGPSFDLPWPPARNPWDVDRFSGGSSSGSAVAVAAGYVMGALGTDTGGSIRSPSGLCGVTGLKPTYGRVSRRGVFPNAFSLDHCGPLARSAEDCALLLQAIAGHDPADPSSAAREVDDYSGGLDEGVEGLRVGVIRHFYERDLPASVEVVVAMEKALAVLQTLGARVTEVVLPSLEAFSACKVIIQLAELYTTYERELRETPQDFGEDFRLKVMPGALISAADYINAQRKRRKLCDEVNRALSSVDVLVTSGIYGPAPRLGDVRAGPSERPSITHPFNVTGHPAISVRSGFSAEGLPLAMQIAGRAFAEATVLRVAHAYEKEAGWQDRAALC